MHGTASSNTAKLSLEDFAWIWVAGFVAMLAGSSTYAVLLVDSDVILRFALKLLFPGIYVAARLTRESHEFRAAVGGSALNAIVYGVLVLAGRLLWRYTADERSLQPTTRRH